METPAKLDANNALINTEDSAAIADTQIETIENDTLVTATGGWVAYAPAYGGWARPAFAPAPYAYAAPAYGYAPAAYGPAYGPAYGWGGPRPHWWR